MPRLDQLYDDYEGWKAHQEQMYGRYVDLINASNAYRQAHYGGYGGVGMLNLNGTPDFSYEAYNQGTNWKDYAPNADMFSNMAYYRNEQGDFMFGLDGSVGLGTRAADNTLHSFLIKSAHNAFDREWKEANPEAWKERWRANAQANKEQRALQNTPQYRWNQLRQQLQQTTQGRAFLNQYMQYVQNRRAQESQQSPGMFGQLRVNPQNPDDVINM